MASRGSTPEPWRRRDGPDEARGLREAGRRVTRAASATLLEAGTLLASGAGSAARGGPAAQHWQNVPRADDLRLEIARLEDRVQPLAPIGSVVTDGLLIAHVAVRMALTNGVLVAALRDRRDFDRAAFVRQAADELRRLAAENEGAAARLAPLVAALPTGARRSLGEQLAVEEQVRRPVVHRALAAELRSAADDLGLLEALVDQAAADAADQYGRAVAAGVAALDPVRDAEYESQKEQRIQALITDDLRALRRNAPSPARSAGSRWTSTRTRS